MACPTSSQLNHAYSIPLQLAVIYLSLTGDLRTHTTGPLSSRFTALLLSANPGHLPSRCYHTQTYRKRSASPVNLCPALLC